MRWNIFHIFSLILILIECIEHDYSIALEKAFY